MVCRDRSTVQHLHRSDVSTLSVGCRSLQRGALGARRRDRRRDGTGPGIAGRASDLAVRRRFRPNARRGRARTDESATVVALSGSRVAVSLGPLHRRAASSLAETRTLGFFALGDNPVVKPSEPELLTEFADWPYDP